MSVEQMRCAIASAYKSQKWQSKVKSMTDSQVIAIYKSMLSNGKLK